MDTKSFIAGAVSGAALMGAAAWLLQKNGPEPAAPATATRLERVDSTKAQERNVPRIDSVAIPAVQEADEGPRRSVAREDERADVPPSGSDTIGSVVRRIPVSISDIHKELITEDGTPDFDSGDPTNRHAALEAEAKDDGWAYYMEQTLLEFLSADRDIGNFEISNIECRTTMCELQVIGYDDSTSPIWTRIVYDLRQQPWSEFSETGSSSSSVEGRLAIVTFLRRDTQAE